MLGTIDRTLEDLVSDSLVHRYKIGGGMPDGLDGARGLSASAPSGWWRRWRARAG